jgi:hypothetical protein
MWDRETKRIVGNALVLEPRVPDAALMSAYEAFSASATGEGFAVSPCFVGASESSDGPAHANPSPPTAPTVQETADPVGVLATIKAFLLGQDPRPTAPVAEIHPSVFVQAHAPETAKEETVADAVEFRDSEEYKAMQTQIAQLLEQDRQRAAREAARDAEVIRERAGTWADAEIASFRALPAERTALIAAFVDAATDDQAAPRMVRFSTASGEETEGNRVEALRARHTARAQHMLTQEQMRMTPEQLKEAGVLFAQRPASSDSETMTKSRHDELVTLSGFSVNANN